MLEFPPYPVATVRYFSGANALSEQAEKSKKKYYTIGSVDRLLDLIEELSQREAWELTELSSRLGLPKTTVHRFLLTLLDRGYVVQERGRGRYSLSLKLYSVASRMVEQTGIISIARPFEEHLRDALGETVNLTVPSGSSMLVIDKRVSPQPLRQDIRLGSLFSIPFSASGRIYFAYADEEARARVMADIRLSSDQKALERMQTLLTEVETLKKQGFETDNLEQFEGIRCIAAPIFDASGMVCAVISVSVPIVRFSPEFANQAKLEVCAAARSISQRLGATA